MLELETKKKRFVQNSVFSVVENDLKPILKVCHLSVYLCNPALTVVALLHHISNRSLSAAHAVRVFVFLCFDFCH